MIRFKNLTKRYGDKVLLSDESYHFPEGERISIVGDNGSGKTTLLKILTRVEEPDGGEVIVPNQCTVGTLPQEPDPNPEPTILRECEKAAEAIIALKVRLDELLKELETNHSSEIMHEYEEVETAFRLGGGYELESKAEKILVGLGFRIEDFDTHPTKLSGGWRMRVELAKLFIKNPRILVLDEPTNHLDLPSLVWVEKFLMAYEGTLIFVSHDKTLLNKLSTITLHLAQGRLTPYKGNFDYFQEQHRLRLEQSRSSFELLQKKKEQLQLFVDRFGAKASKAKQAKSKMKMVDKLADEQGTLQIDEKKFSIHLKLPKPSPVERIPYVIEEGAIGYPEKTLCKGINLTIERGQKIAIIGANGIGKSTLLKTMANLIPSLAGTFTPSIRCGLSYFAQDQLDILDEKASILDNVMQNTMLSEVEVRSILGGLLFSGPDVRKEVRVLSGGEKSRVGLACMLVKQGNFLVLDEPTNHLDMSSVERLIDALRLYQGTLMFVSHDRHFINSICTHVFVMTKEGKSQLFIGDTDEYEAICEAQGFENVLRGDDFTTLGKAQDKKASSLKDSSSAKSEKNKLDKKIKENEELQKKIVEELGLLEKKLEEVDPTDYEKIVEISEKKVSLEKKLETLEEEWLSLH